MKKISTKDLLDSYDNFLLDAFGVLVNAEGAIDFAADFIEHLNRLQKNYLVISNGSKYPVIQSAESYRQKGINIDDDKVITSGSLLEDWYKENKGFEKTKVVGPECSLQLIKDCGGEIVHDNSFKTVVVCNQDGFVFPDFIDQVISEIAQKSSLEEIKLVLPNPDLIYPSKSGFGVTSGSISQMIENALSIITSSTSLKFEKLGKPYAPIFTKALSRLKGKTCMIGDQFETDILGANNAGIDSVLVETGICKAAQLASVEALKAPKYYLSNLQL